MPILNAEGLRLPNSATVVTATTTLTPSNRVVYIMGAGTYTITLPKPSECFGRGIYFVHQVAGSGSITLTDTTGSPTTTLTFITTNDRWTGVSNGLTWVKVNLVTA